MTGGSRGGEDDYENQREGGGEARETVRGDADDAMEKRRTIEDGRPGGATKGGEGGQRRRGEKENRRRKTVRANKFPNPPPATVYSINVYP